MTQIKRIYTDMLSVTISHIPSICVPFLVLTPLANSFKTIPAF
jgi:hypothetical protein